MNSVTNSLKEDILKNSNVFTVGRLLGLFSVYSTVAFVDGEPRITVNWRRFI